jgi:hypothetical protein
MYKFKCILGTFTSLNQYSSEARRFSHCWIRSKHDYLQYPMPTFFDQHQKWQRLVLVRLRQYNKLQETVLLMGLA